MVRYHRHLPVADVPRTNTTTTNNNNNNTLAQWTDPPRSLLSFRSDHYFPRQTDDRRWLPLASPPARFQHRPAIVIQTLSVHISAIQPARVRLTRSRNVRNAVYHPAHCTLVSFVAVEPPTNVEQHQTWDHRRNNSSNNSSNVTIIEISGGWLGNRFEFTLPRAVHTLITQLGSGGSSFAIFGASLCIRASFSRG